MGVSQSVMDSVYNRRLDIENLKRIMTYGRPASSEMEKEWVNKYLFTPEMQAAGMYKDGFHYPRQSGEGEGNLIIEVGEGSKTIFSSHTDTVHRTGVIQNVIIDPTESKLKFTTDSGQCLGGDDGTGVWLMLELIKAGVPGLYIFHRAEEVGGQGSSFIANSTPELIEGYDRAIAFDRKDDWSIITHQAGTRTCSDAFGEDLAQKLGMNHRTDTTGSFTDTANYDSVIPECTNLSVGYHNAHSARENQEIDYLLKFRDALVNVDWESLVTERDPSVAEYSTYGYYGYGDRLMKPKKSAREKMNWGDFEDQQFEKNRAKEEAAKEKASTTITPPKESVIKIEEVEGEDLLAFLDKPLNSMTDEEFHLSELLESGIISLDELEAMMDMGDTTGTSYEVVEDEPMPEGWDEFFDDYGDGDASFDKGTSTTKDFADYEDDDFDWEMWFKSQ